MDETTKSRSFLLQLVVVSLLVGACGGGDRSYQIEKTRVVPLSGEQLNAPDWRRLGFRRQNATDRPGSTSPRFVYEVPAGWEQRPPRQFREVNLKVGDVECYVSMLSGGGGGLARNVNRWRQQMGLEPYAAAELQALPRRQVLGRDGVLTECVGTFKAKPGHKLVAAFVQFPAFAVSVKMIGPQAEVDAARAGFEKFVDSLKIDWSAGSRQDASGQRQGSFDRSKLKWDVPDGWKLASGSSMRIVTFKVAGKVEGQPGAECWVIALGGRAGGIIGNINRWRQEMQKPHLSAQDVDRLPRIQILGEQAPFLEEDGSYQGMGGPKLDKGMLFGVVCPLADVTLFIKMVGGPEDMRAAKNDFLAFCKSLRMES